MMKEVRVLARSGAYRSVAIEELHALLAAADKTIDVHYVNAVGAFADPAFRPLLGRALSTGDPALLRAVSRVAIKFKAFELVPALKKAELNMSDSLAKCLVSAALIYLTHPDRGLFMIESGDRLSLYLVSNLLAVTTFDEADLKLALGSFRYAAEKAKQTTDKQTIKELNESTIPDAINGLLGALMEPRLRDYLGQQDRFAVLSIIDDLRVNKYYKRLDRDAQQELKEIEQLLL